MIQFFGKKDVIKGLQIKSKSIVNKIAEDHKHQINSISIIFIDDEQMLEMNKSVLDHNYYTDILTFDYTEESSLEGEIYISIDRVKENAITFAQEFHVELLRVIAHGILHMVGYKDKTKNQKEEMRKKETYYINLNN